MFSQWDVSISRDTETTLHYITLHYNKEVETTAVDDEIPEWRMIEKVIERMIEVRESPLPLIALGGERIIKVTLGEQIKKNSAISSHPLSRWMCYATLARRGLLSKTVYNAPKEHNTNGRPKTSKAFKPFHSQHAMSNFPCSLTRNIASHSMKNFAFRSLLRERTNKEAVLGRMDGTNSVTQLKQVVAFGTSKRPLLRQRKSSDGKIVLEW